MDIQITIALQAIFISSCANANDVLLITQAWQSDVYTGRHFDDLVADDNGYARENSVLLMYTPHCDTYMRDATFISSLPPIHALLAARYDYESTPSYLWYHMDYQDDLRRRYPLEQCLDILHFPRGQPIDTPLRYDVTPKTNVTQLLWNAIKVELTVTNQFGRELSVFVENNGTVYFNATVEFRKELKVNAFLSHILYVRQTRSNRMVAMYLITPEMSRDAVIIDWSKTYIDEQQARKEIQNTLSTRTRALTKHESELAQLYLHDLKQPSIVPVFTEFGYQLQPIPTFVLRPLVEHYKSQRANEQLIKTLGQAKYANIPLEHTLKLKYSSVLRVLAQDWADVSLLLTKTTAFREHGPGFSAASHLGNLASQVIGVYMVLACDFGKVKRTWPLEIIAHDGVRRNITIQEGEMLLYEPSSVLIGRPYPYTGSLCVTFSVYFKPSSDWQWRVSHDREHYKHGSDVIESLRVLATSRTRKRAGSRGTREEL